LRTYPQPKLAVDCIILVRDRVVLVERRNPPDGWALPGGFVDEGETLEQAVRREMMEETGLELDDLEQFHAYSDPARDPRWHCVSVVFTASGRGEMRAGDDARRCRLADPRKLDSSELAFDHARVLSDFVGGRYGRRRLPEN
jgi:ADP-ribose pyrophosphatase YjhB (NUDIX family)